MCALPDLMLPQAPRKPFPNQSDNQQPDIRRRPRGPRVHGGSPAAAGPPRPCAGGLWWGSGRPAGSPCPRRRECRTPAREARSRSGHLSCPPASARLLRCRRERARTECGPLGPSCPRRVDPDTGRGHDVARAGGENEGTGGFRGESDAHAELLVRGDLMFRRKGKCDTTQRNNENQKTQSRAKLNLAHLAGDGGGFGSKELSNQSLAPPSTSPEMNI